MRVPVEVLRVQAIEQRLPSCAHGLATATARHKVAEPREASVEVRGVECGLPPMGTIPMSGKPVQLPREPIGEGAIGLLRHSGGWVASARCKRAERAH